MYLRLITCLGLITSIYAVPTPKRQAGFVYKEESRNAPVHLDVYIDQICPDSKRAWPTMLQVADHYGPSKLKLTVHEFALPYHRNGFYTSKGAFIVEKTDKTFPFTWIQKVYDNYDMLINSYNLNKSDSEILLKLSEIAADMGVQNTTFLSLFNNGSIEMEARVAWKYACTRRVAETPTFMVNDVVVGYTPASFWTLDDWKMKIDPLLRIVAPTKPPTTPKTSGSVMVNPGGWILALGIFIIWRAKGH